MLTEEVKRVAEHARAVLGDSAGWEAPYGYELLDEAVLDAVFSINARYKSVENVIERWRTHAKSEKLDDHRASLQTLVDEGRRVGAEAFAASLLHNRQRTSTHGGLLKAEAALLCSEALLAQDISTAEQLRERTHDKAVQRAWTAVPGQRSGVSWRYLLMLCRVDGVKPDRMVQRFVAEALGVPNVAASKAGEQLEGAALQLGVKARDLDYEVWATMRRKSRGIES